MTEHTDTNEPCHHWADGYAEGQKSGALAAYTEQVRQAHAESEAVTANRIAAWLDSEADAAYRRREPDSALDYELMAKAIRRGDWKT